MEVQISGIPNGKAIVVQPTKVVKINRNLLVAGKEDRKLQSGEDQKKQKGRKSPPDERWARELNTQTAISATEEGKRS
jgi:hypothetical protein